MATVGPVDARVRETEAASRENCDTEHSDTNCTVDIYRMKICR